MALDLSERPQIFPLIPTNRSVILPILVEKLCPAEIALRVIVRAPGERSVGVNVEAAGGGANRSITQSLERREWKERRPARVL